MIKEHQRPCRSFNRAEIADFIGLFIFDTLKKHTYPHSLTLYGDHGLAILSPMSSHDMDKVRKKLIKIFKEFDLSITVTTSLTNVDFLDITLDLKMGKHCPFRKSNEETVYTQKLQPPQL